MKQGIFYKGRIYKDATIEEPNHLNYKCENKYSELVWNSHHAMNRYGDDYDDFIGQFSTLKSFPYTGTEILKDGQVVVEGKDYEIEYECKEQIEGCVGCKCPRNAIPLQSDNIEQKEECTYPKCICYPDDHCPNWMNQNKKELTTEGKGEPYFTHNDAEYDNFDQEKELIEFFEESTGIESADIKIMVSRLMNQFNCTRK